MIQKDKDQNGTPKDAPQTTMGQAFKEAGMASPQAAASTRTEAPAQSNVDTASRPIQNNTKSNAMDINTIFKRDISRSGLSGAATLYQDAFKKLLEKLPDAAKTNYQIFLVDGVGTHFSSIVLVKAYSQGGVPVVAAYTYQIEASAGKLPPRQVSHAGTTFSLPTAPGDAIDNTLWERVEQFLQNSFGQSAKIFNAGAQPIFAEVQPTDELRIALLFRQAVDATSTTMVQQGVIKEQPLDVKLLVSGGQPVTGVDNNPAPLFDIQGMPIRSDFRIVTRKAGEQNSNTTQWNPNDNRNKDLVATDLYIDLDYSPVQQAANPYGAQIPGQFGFQQAPSWRYVPRAVITNIESLTDASTPELLGLGLGQAIVMSRRNYWLQAFAPRWPATAKKGEPNLRDATAIGFEVNLTGAEKPTRLPYPSQQETNAYYQMLAAAISPNLMYSIDIDEAGDNTWLTRDLYLAAHNDPEAKKRIVTAFNNLTDGKFSAFWDGTQPMAIDENNRVPLGYWTPSTGVKADIRQLDYLAMLNIVGEGDMKILHEWSATFWDVNVPMEVRLERRDRIQRELLAGYVLRGHARRLVLTSALLGAIVKSLEAAGLLLQSNDTLIDLTGQTVRGNYTTVNQALDFNAIGGGGLFASGMGPAQQFRGAVSGVGFGGLGR